MATKITDPVLKRAVHYIELNRFLDVDNEEVYIYFETEWRGDPCLVEMKCRRTRWTSASGDTGQGDWQAYARSVTGGTMEERTLGVNFTDTAKSRLGDACRPLCLAWLADEEKYQASRKREMFRVVKGTLYDVRATNEYATRDIKRALEKHGSELTEAERVYLVDLIAAADNFLALYEKKVD